jgi:dipeptidyl aminopeptidase/acylaminoacyl peptidase
MRNGFSAMAFASLMAMPATAAPRPWTIDDILAVRNVTDPQVSPDGRWVAYVISELNADGSDYNTDVWLVSTDGGEARRLTNSPVADESPRWSPDGRTLAFLSDRPRPAAKADDAKSGAATGDEGRRQAWLIRPDGGEAWVLTDSRGGVSGIEWSGDGRLLGFLAREPKSDERRKKEKEKDDAWTPSSVYPWNRLWVMDVAARRATQLTRGEVHVTGFSLSPDGAQAVFAGQPTPLIPDQFHSDLYLVATAGGSARPVVRRPGVDNSPAWSPDGRWIAFVSQDEKSTAWYANNHLCVVSPAGGKPSNLSTTFDERVQGLGGGGLAWSPDARFVSFQSNARTAQHLYRVSPADGTVQALTAGPEMNSALSYDAQGRVAVFLRESAERPRELVRVRLPDGAPEFITDTNPQVRGLLSFRKEPVAWNSPDGRPIEGLLIYPAGYRAGQKAPLVLNIHGGPAGTHSNTFAAGSRTYAWPLFAQKGYAILMPNPRGSGGYGGAFRAANVRDWGGKDYQDIMAGVDAMIERGIADPGRLAVCGWSYGGFMTSTMVTKTDRFRAAVVGAGVTDLISMAGTSDIPEFNRSYFESWPWEDPQFYLDHSAVLHAGKVRTPTLLVHGEKDERVPPSQGWEFYTALKKVGVPTDLLLLPRQPHGPREPRLQRSVAEWTLDWIDRYTRAGAPAARGPDRPAPRVEKPAGMAGR